MPPSYNVAVAYPALSLAALQVPVRGLIRIVGYDL